MKDKAEIRVNQDQDSGQFGTPSKFVHPGSLGPASGANIGQQHKSSVDHLAHTSGDQVFGPSGEQVFTTSGGHVIGTSGGHMFGTSGHVAASSDEGVGTSLKEDVLLIKKSQCHSDPVVAHPDDRHLRWPFTMYNMETVLVEEEQQMGNKKKSKKVISPSKLIWNRFIIYFINSFVSFKFYN